MRRSISEILAEANAKKKKEDIIAVLQDPRYNTFALRHVLRCCFDPSIVWRIPPGPVQYKKHPYFDQEGMLYTEARRFYLFIEGGNPDLDQARCETLFVQMLEVLDAADATLMIEVKDKKLTTYKKITDEIVLEAFPGLY